MKRLIAHIIVILIMIIGILAPHMDTQAITPKVILSEYSLSSDEIYPGDSFTVTFKLKNTSKNTIMNLKCTISSDKGDFIPVDSTGSTYIKEIKGEQEEEISFNMKGVNKLEEKSYKLTIKSEYEDWNGKYEASDIIYVPVKLKTEVVISDTYIAEEEIRLGDNIEIVSSIHNVGGADIYKVKAVASGDNIEQSTSFIGNIKAGKNGNIDIITKATNVTTPSTRGNMIEVFYEDYEGNEYSEKIKLGQDGVIEVLEQDFSDIIKIKEDKREHLTDKDKLIIIIGAVILIILILIIRRALKRRKLEREFD